MKVDLTCFSSLAKEDTCNYNDSTPYELKEGQTVHDLIRRAGIEPRDVKIAFVNHRIAGTDKVLANGDRVGLAPAVGGM